MRSGHGEEVVFDVPGDGEAAELGITHFAGPGYRGCRFVGEVDFVSAGPLQATLTSMVLPGGGTVVADLSEVSFIDSSGLGALVQCYRTAAERDTRLVVVASAPVRRLLRVTGLDTVLKIHDDLADAEADIAAGRRADG
jgi:anti-sigma B factor antagonist